MEILKKFLKNQKKKLNEKIDSSNPFKGKCFINISES